VIISAGVLLTGGSSSRMGTNKATLPLGNESFATRAARILSEVCRPVIEVGDGVSGLRHVREEPRGDGPLAALLAGAAALATDQPVVLLACDLPFVDTEILRAVADHASAGSVVPVVAGHKQYACSRWSAAAIAAARVAFSQGERAMRALLGGGDATMLDADAYAQQLLDADTPDDLRRLGLS